jgi:phage virion morphogenesis protein
MADDVQGLNRLLSRVSRLATATRHVEQALNSAGAYAVSSVEKNFEQQGRPKKWSPLAPATLQRRRKGRGRGGPKILIDKATMKNSIDYRVHSEGVVVGLNAVQARRQHFGYDGDEGRGHSKTPARAFMLLQEPEDTREIGEIFKRHVSVDG